MRASKERKTLLNIMKKEKKEIGGKNNKTDWSKYRVNDYEKLKELLKSPEYFLGIRENYVNIYYKGMSMAKIETFYGHACKYTTSYYYVKDISGYENKKSGQIALSPQEFWNDENQIKMKNRINMHVFGENDKKMRLEKVCQQWIMNANNSNPDSDWYYIDLEYIYKEDGEKEDHPFGRADLIAISRKPNADRKHEIAFVELKVGVNAYKGKPDNEEKMFILKNKSLYCKEVEDIKLGSGLASHLVDFLQFFGTDNYKKQVKTEILGMIDWHKEFGLIDLDSDLGKIVDESQIIDKPYIYITTYSTVPGLEGTEIAAECRKNMPNETLQSMKQRFYEELFTSKMPFIEIIKKEEADGFWKLKDRFERILSDDNEFQIPFEQKIKDQEYKFVFRFIDLSNLRCKASDCIEAQHCIKS